MKYEITREHEIAAGHRVAGHESKCAHLHGHNYTFELTCAADNLDAIGRVIDFAVIKDKLCAWLERNWDHRMLLWSMDPWAALVKSIDDTTVWLPVNPTAENLAAYLVQDVGPGVLDGTGVTLVRVRVWETGKCSAEFARSE